MINSVYLIGRVTRDPAMRQTSSGTLVASYSIANNGKKRSDGTQDVVYMDLLSTGKQSEIVRDYVRKGHLIAVRGRICQNRYTDNAGKQRSSYFVMVEELDMLTPKDDKQPEQPKPEPNPTDDELPF